VSILADPLPVPATAEPVRWAGIAWTVLLRPRQNLLPSPSRHPTDLLFFPHSLFVRLWLTFLVLIIPVLTCYDVGILILIPAAFGIRWMISWDSEWKVFFFPLFFLTSRYLVSIYFNGVSHPVGGFPLLLSRNTSSLKTQFLFPLTFSTSRIPLAGSLGRDCHLSI